VFQVLASVRISQCQVDEAKAMMKKSMDLWFDKGEFL